jgi:hypothetical protein
MARLRNQFRSIESTQQGPYFRGYCGEHESEYQGAIQLAGTPLGNAIIKSFYSFSQTSTIAGSSMLTEVDGARARNRARLDEESRRFRATILRPRPTSSAYTRIRGRACPDANAGPSIARNLNFGVPSVREQEILDRLQAGEGILGTEMGNLFEKCTLCDDYFVASLLRVHIRGCAPDL